MKFEKTSLKSCCGSKFESIAYKLKGTLNKDYLALFIAAGFNEVNHFTKISIFYVENENLIATGAFGSDHIQLKCKKTDCKENIFSFETIINNLE